MPGILNTSPILSPRRPTPAVPRRATSIKLEACVTKMIARSDGEAGSVVNPIAVKEKRKSVSKVPTFPGVLGSMKVSWNSIIPKSIAIAVASNPTPVSIK